MLLETMDNEPVSQEDFLRASERVRAVSQSQPLAIPPDQHLLLYALFKQASEGDAPLSAASSNKIDAWRSVAGIPREAAAKAYVFLVRDLEACLSADTASSSLGDHGLGSVFSSLVGDSSAAQGEEWRAEEALFAAIAAEDFSRLQDLLSSSSDVPAMLDARMQGGLTALHYAADRGVGEAVRLLLAAGAVVQTQDDEGRSPLAYALLCDHLETARQLIEAGARVAEALSQAQMDEEDLSPPMAALLTSNSV